MKDDNLFMPSPLIMDLIYRTALMNNTHKIQIGVDRKRTLVGLTRKVQLQNATIRELVQTIGLLQAENEKLRAAPDQKSGG